MRTEDAKDVFERVAPWYDLFMRVFGLYRTEEIMGMLALEGTEVILDLGGGTGFLAKRLVPLAREVHLLDLSPAMVSRVGNGAVRARVGNALEMPYGPERFDVVILSDVFHHVTDRERLVAETARVLREGGKLLVHDFDRETFRGRVLERLESLKLREIAYTTPGELEIFLGRWGFVPLARKDGWSFLSLFRKAT